MSSEKLEECEERLKALLEAVQSAITYQLPRKDGDDRRRTVQSLERKLKEAEELLRDINSELKRAPKVYQLEASSRVVQYRRSLVSLKKQLSTGSFVREELFAGNNGYLDDGMGGEHEELIRKTETLGRASESLYRAQQVTAETDQVAIGVLEELDEQKSTLLRTREKLHGIDSEMNRTKSLLRQIACGTIQNRLILIGVIIVELLLLAGLTYWKFFS